MKRVLRTVGILVCLVGLAVWLAFGANRGWTKTSVQVKKVDPITEQEFVEWQKKFVPGAEFLVGSLFAGSLLLGISFLQRKKSAPTGQALETNL
jgi:hypothetical protein